MAMYWDWKTDRFIIGCDLGGKLEMEAIGLSNADDLAKLEEEKEMRKRLDKLKKELAKTKKQKKTFAETPYRIPSEPEKIIKNGPVVIVFWKDKTKTIVRKKPDDPDDIYSAVAQAIMKKWCGSTSHAHKWIDKLLVNKEESK